MPIYLFLFEKAFAAHGARAMRKFPYPFESSFAAASPAPPPPPAPAAVISQTKIPLSAQHTANRVASDENASATTAEAGPSSFGATTAPVLERF